MCVQTDTAVSSLLEDGTDVDVKENVAYIANTPEISSWFVLTIPVENV